MLLRTSLRWCGVFLATARLPSRRAIAALAKLNGFQLERRPPYLSRLRSEALPLGFEDILELQYSRRRRLSALCIGAFDGLANDPAGQFLRTHHCKGLLLEPQPHAFHRLRENCAGHPWLTPLNLAIDESTGARTLYYVPAGAAGLPSWTEQLASFRIEHLQAHEDQAPGIRENIREIQVQSVSFGELIDTYNLQSLDLLQIDAEGFDAELLEWFPFDRLRPAIVHYEITHLSPERLLDTRQRLLSFGYQFPRVNSTSDDVALIA